MAHKLLLADDSVTIQRVIELTFADEDIDVIAVGDGQQAINRIEADRPDVVLADVGMPERDGYEVAAYVKRSAHLSHIPVLLLTGAFEPVDEARARAAGCDGVLVKPFEPQMVINRVKDLLAGRRPDSLWATSPSAERGSSPGLPVREMAPVGGDTPRDTAGSPSDSLDDYFDRLDAAFADIKTPEAAPADSPVMLEPPPPPPPSPSPSPPPRPAEPELLHQTDAGVIGADAFDRLEPGPVEVVHDAGLGDWDPTLSRAGPIRAAEQDGAQPRAADPPPPVEEPPARPAEPIEATKAVAPVPMSLPSLSDAFEALLSAEQGYATRSAPVPAPEVVTDETVDLVVRRVIERLTSDLVRDTVVDVAERLVREEIARIKNAAR